jgi:Ca2+-binding RTX toxin-like protein
MATPVVRGNSLYTVVDGPSWAQAEANAVAKGGDLVSIQSMAENNFLVSIFDRNQLLVAPNNSNYAAWIGLAYDKTQGRFVDIGHNLQLFFNWAPGQPDNPQTYLGDENTSIVFTNPAGWGIGTWDDSSDLQSVPYYRNGIAEIPLTSSITFSSTPKEGAGEFTTSINLSAGNQSTGNLAEGAHVYWKVTGIQQSDLAAGYSLTGDGVITNGKLDFKEALVDDHIKNSKSLSVSVYSDSGYQNQIGTTATTSIQDSINLDIGSTITTASKTTILDATTSRLTLTGTGNINGTGNALNNYITGNDGNNILDGVLGNDILAGGKGNDTYIVDSIYDTVIEKANEGTDLVKSSVNWTLGANLENLTLTGSDNLSGTGNELANIIIGNYGNNALDGGAGNDTLEGNSGNDTLICGLGNDVMKGGAGNDTYYVDSTGDTISDTSGTDTVVASISWTLGLNLENLTLTGSDPLTGIGNSLKNTIIGNAGNNVLDGMGGTDSLTGGAGADTFRFSTRPVFGASTADHITDFKAAEGDKLQISKSAYGLASDATATLTTISSATELSTALGSATTFVYDSSNGNLYWNQNGIKSGFGSGGIFAVLDNHSALSASNISLV